MEGWVVIADESEEEERLADRILREPLYVKKREVNMNMYYCNLFWIALYALVWLGF